MINSNAIPTHSTTMSSKSPIPDQKNISLQNNDPITDQEKVRANFWAVAETAVLIRTIDYNKYIYDADNPKATVKILYLKWANDFADRASDTYHNIQLLLSEKVGPHNLDQFQCSSSDDFNNKKSVKLYALQCLSKELSDFMLKFLKYRAGLNLPESSGGQSYLEHPSVLVQIILKSDESEKPACLREYLDAMTFPEYNTPSECLQAMISLIGRLDSLDDATHPDKYKTVFSINSIYHLLPLMKNKEGKEKTKLALYRSMRENKTIKWEDKMEEIENLTPEQTGLFFELFEDPEPSTQPPLSKILNGHPRGRPYTGGSLGEEISPSQSFTSDKNGNDNKKRLHESETSEYHSQRKRHHPDEREHRRRRGGWISDDPSQKVKKLLEGPMCAFCCIRHNKRTHPIDARREPFTPLSDFIESDRIREIFYRHGTDRLRHMLFMYLINDETNEELKRMYCGKFEPIKYQA
ncbi:unnamed protein product [Ambrosiozyma monospora]|uniref:Unnamed protein product n=1 Tax=Ambrosiozyma monospora TaxID=43982 RepID=A0A9W7DLM1_AMBMO|nr:unnamed protein product [Ambrosiozyma monospora]